MKRSVRMSKLAAQALSALEKRPHVVGVARDRSNRLTFLLDQDDEATRSEVERWGRSHATEISIKVIGRIVGS